ncbi:MAG: cytochrome c oxidase assembly protein [Candidatus Hodgkinia cicadicola]
MSFPFPVILILYVLAISTVCLSIGRLYDTLCTPTIQTRERNTIGNLAKVNVTFEVNVNPTLVLTFKPMCTKISLFAGEVAKTSYVLQNHYSRSVIVSASYTISPSWASRLFVKLECFCFKRIVLGPSAKLVLPLVFYVDPKLQPSSQVLNLTLTYSLFPIV